jgi:PAS domain S-box-containing protein
MGGASDGPFPEALAARFIDGVRDYALIFLNQSGLILGWNAGAADVFSYRAEEALGKHLLLLYPTDAVATGEPDRHLEAARRDGVVRMETALVRREGALFVASMALQTLPGAAGGVDGFGLVVRDMTAERRALLRADTASAQLHAIQRVTEVGLARLPFEELMAVLLERVAELLAADTVVVLLKDDDELVAVAALGLEEEVEQGVRVPLGMGFAGRVALERRHVIVTDVSQYPVVNPILRTRGLRSLLGVPLMVEGEVRGVLHVGSLSSRQFTEEDAELLQVVADRVALALAHARLAEAEQEARTEAATAAATARLREQFLGITAHELKTPLTVVNGYALMLQRALERGTLDATVLRAAVTEIATQASRLDRLINDLLETSRVHEGRLTLDVEPMDLARLARDVARRFTDGPEASAAHEVVVDAPEPVIGEWDVSRLDQVITNLVSNAIKYSPQGGTVTIAVRRRAGGGAALSVQDEGIGIPALAQRDLFQPFSRLAGSRDRGGIGLGLFLASQFVRRHGGTITVRSEVSRGSTFTVELPSSAAFEDEAETDLREAPAPGI